MHLPWNDRKGQFSSLKAAALAIALVPGVLLAYWLASGQMGALPLKAAMKFLGLWSIRFLLISLTLTPLQRILQWPKLALIRRIAGVTAATYAAMHFTMFIPYSGYDLGKVASEVVLRLYLTIGLVALLGLLALAATSTDRMVSRLGAGWKKLHRIVYIIAPLGLLHYAMQEKLDVTAPLQLLGLFILLMLLRAIIARRIALTPMVLVLATVGGAATTAAFEACWYWTTHGIDPMRIISANLSLANGLRPAIAVAIAGLATICMALLRQLQAERRPATA